MTPSTKSSPPSARKTTARWFCLGSEAPTPKMTKRLLTHIPVGAMVGNPPSGVPAKPLTTPNPLARVAKHPSGDGAIYSVFQVTNSMRSDLLVRDASDLSTAESATFGTAQQNNFRPSIAGGDNGGAIAWYRYTESPLRNSISVQSFNAKS